MNDVFTVLASNGFQRSMQSLSIVALFLAAGCVLVALSFYARARETSHDGTDPWTMLFATLRDSFLITVLYVGAGLVHRFVEFFGLSEFGVTSVLLYPHLVQPVAMLAIDVMVFAIAALRIIALTHWIAARARAA